MDRRFNIKNRDRVVKASTGIEFFKISNHWIFKLATLVVASLILYSVSNSVILTIQKVNFLKEAEREVQELRLENLHLSLGIKDMSTDKYLEKEARDRLNFGGKGELVFVIPDATLELAVNQVLEIVSPKVDPVYEKVGNVDEWFSFVIAGI